MWNYHDSECWGLRYSNFVIKLVPWWIRSQSHKNWSKNNPKNSSYKQGTHKRNFLAPKSLWSNLPFFWKTYSWNFHSKPRKTYYWRDRRKVILDYRSFWQFGPDWSCKFGSRGKKQQIWLQNQNFPPIFRSNWRHNRQVYSRWEHSSRWRGIGNSKKRIKKGGWNISHKFWHNGSVHVIPLDWLHHCHYGNHILADFDISKMYWLWWKVACFVIKESLLWAYFIPSTFILIFIQLMLFI